MATPAINELRLSTQQGDSLVVPIALVDDDGDAVTLVDGSMKFALAHSPNAAAALVEKSNGSGIVFDNEAGGLATLTVDPADTTDLPSGRYYYELEFTSALPQTTTFQYGRLDIRPKLIVASEPEM